MPKPPTAVIYNDKAFKFDGGVFLGNIFRGPLARLTFVIYLPFFSVDIIKDVCITSSELLKYSVEIPINELSLYCIHDLK